MALASTSPALKLFEGRTTHARYAPFEQRFAYDLFLVDVDIDRLDEVDRASAVFSVDRPNLFSFKRRDHGPRDGGGLRSWADDMFADAGVDLEGGEIRLVTFPRHLFYKFAPLSLWYGHGPDGALRGLIYEVNNTFGDTHCYAAKASGTRDIHEAAKSFHVSPFFDVSGRYRFTARPLGRRLDLVVDTVSDNGARAHMANMKAVSKPATTPNLLRAALRRPFSTHGVTAAIHWEALKIWKRGGRYHRRPSPPETPVTIAQPMAELAGAHTSESLCLK